MTPGDGLEKYLGAWGHMLAASDDLIDMTHTHPSSPTALLRFSSTSPSRALAPIGYGCNFSETAL
jgi:hypothetical protein